MITLTQPNPLKPFPGDCYSYKDGVLVVVSLNPVVCIITTVYNVSYFMNGAKYTCSLEEFPYLIKSLPL
jgi:hypothetical protein